MPGQPRTRADRITRLAERAQELNYDLWEAAPSWCREGAPARTPVDTAWASAADSVARLSKALRELTNLLRERAGMPPWDRRVVRSKKVRDRQTE